MGKKWKRFRRALGFAADVATIFVLLGGGAVLTAVAVFLSDPTDFQLGALYGAAAACVLIAALLALIAFGRSKASAAPAADAVLSAAEETELSQLTSQVTNLVRSSDRMNVDLGKLALVIGKAVAAAATLASDGDGQQSTPTPLRNPESYTQYRRAHPLIVAPYETLRKQDREHVVPRAESLPVDDPRRISIELLHEGPLAQLEARFQELDTQFKVAESARGDISQMDFESLVNCAATFLVEYGDALRRWMQVGWSVWGWPSFAHEVSMPLSAPHDYLRRMLREFENRGDILQELSREFARIPREGFSPPT